MFSALDVAQFAMEQKLSVQLEFWRNEFHSNVCVCGIYSYSGLHSDQTVSGSQKQWEELVSVELFFVQMQRENNKGFYHDG